MQYLGYQPIGGIYNSTAPLLNPLYDAAWSIELYHKSNGIKKSWVLGENNCPIVNIKFENNLNGCGAADISFNNIDFPLDPDDFFNIYYSDKKLYTGYVKTIPDIKGGTVQLNGPKTKLSRVFAPITTFTNQTIAKILQSVITNVQNNTNIYYNPFMIDTGDIATYTLTFNYQYSDQVINDLVGRLTDRYWGVDENNFLFVRKLNTAVDDVLFYTETPAYTDISISTDYSGIAMTRAQVQKKVSYGAGTIIIGHVGYPGDSILWPNPQENLVGVKEGIITIPDTLTSDADGLHYAGNVIASQEYFSNITINNVNIERYNPPQPMIGRKITVQDREEQILTTINSCESTAGWGSTGSSTVILDNTNYIEGTGSIQFTVTNTNDSGYLLFSPIYMGKNIQSIGFMVRSSIPGNFMKFYIQDNVGDTINYPFNIPAANEWLYVQVPCTFNIYIIKLVALSAPLEPARINIDRIQTYEQNRMIYTENIIQSSYDISPQNNTITLGLKQYYLFANKEIFSLQNSANITQTVLQNTGSAPINLHNSLSDLQGGTTNEYYHLTSAQQAGLTTFTTGSIPFASATNILSQDNANLFWDAPNKRAGILTNAPEVTFEIKTQATTLESYSMLLRETVGTENNTRFCIVGGTPVFQMSGTNGGTYTAPITASDGSTLGILQAGGFDSSSKNYSRARIWFYAGGTWSPTSQPSYMAFQTTNINATLATEKMRITSEGQIGIGATNPASLNSRDTVIFIGGGGRGIMPGLVLNPASNYSTNLGWEIWLGAIAPSHNVFIISNGTNQRLKIDNNGYLIVLGVYNATVGATNRDVYVDNTGLLGYVSSALKYKENIKPIKNEMIAKGYKLNPVVFDYKDKSKGLKQQGFVADEIEKLFPELVSYNITLDDDGNEISREVETYSKQGLVPILSALINDLNDRVNNQKQTINDLEKINDDFKTRLKKLENDKI